MTTTKRLQPFPGLPAIHPHEVEEAEFAMGPRLWDASPGVCCAAFQLGACCHTEAYDADIDQMLAVAEPYAEAPAVAVDVCFRCGGGIAFDEAAEVYRLVVDPDAIYCGAGTDGHEPAF